MQEKISVAVVGLGNIGMMYDYNSTPGIYLSHANAFCNNPSFDVRYLIDMDPDKLEKARRKFISPGISFVRSVEDIESFPKVVVLASVPEVNRVLFQKLKDKEAIKLLVIEKPFWDNMFEKNDYLAYSDKCLVNYFRKFLPEYRRIRQEIGEGKYGIPLSAHVWYSKGLRNNGSHLIDLLFFLLRVDGEGSDINVFQSITDYKDSDLSLGFTMKLEKDGRQIPVVFQVSDERLFSLIECDILFEKGRLRIHDFGAQIEFFEIREDKLFPGYRNMETSENRKIGFEDCMMHMTRTISEIVRYQGDNPSSLENEYNIHRLIQDVKQKNIII